jgi:hypothetical protein
MAHDAELTESQARTAVENAGFTLQSYARTGDNQ